MATTAATLTITPVHPAFAAEVAGVDLTQRLDDVTFERIAVASTTTRCWSSGARP